MAARGPLGAVARGKQALSRQFPSVDAEALDLFIDTCGGVPDSDTIASLAEMEQEARQASIRRGAYMPSRACHMGWTTPGDGAFGEAEPELQLDGGGDPPRVGTVLLLGGLAAFCAPPGSPAAAKLGGEEALWAAVATPTGEVLHLERQEGPTCFWAREYGMHELRVLGPEGVVRRCRFMVTSHLGDYAEALDHFHDACDWVWDGEWTEELEEATMTLLAALDDYFASMEAACQRNALMGSTIRSEIGPAKRRLENSLEKALEQHDSQAVGRVYGAVRGLLQHQSLVEMFGPMMGGGCGPIEDTPLYQSVLAFERARFAAASEGKRAEIKAILSRLILTADAHVAELAAEGLSPNFVNKWQAHLRDILVQMRDDSSAVIHPLPFQQLRGGEGGYLQQMMRSVLDGFGGAGSRATTERSDTIEALSGLGPQILFREAEAKVARWNESLVDESVQLGSPLAPFEIHDREPWLRTVMAVLRSALSLGFGYVTQGSREAEESKVTLLLDRNRATLPLNCEEEFLRERRRRDRLKDVARVLRAAKKKGQRLSLSVNTDFAGAIRALNEHHTESWVGACLAAVWTKMAQERQVFAFELWLHEAPGPGEAAPKPPKLVAADFGHPHTNGQAYYVATRFFDREYRTLMPGFILAFAEASCLKQAGFELWDLGGADHSPMMQYKPQVAVEMNRTDFLRRLSECKRAGVAAVIEAGGNPPQPDLPITAPEASLPALGEKVPTGTIFDDISEEQLWGTQVLQAREEQHSIAMDAAKKAAKKQQKPPKASRKAAGRGGASASFAPPARVPGAPDTAVAPAGPTSDPASAADAATAAPQSTAPARDDAEVTDKAAAKQQFVALFQQLMAEGVSQNEAAARALLGVSR